jgi:hypothetical protein
MIASMLRSVRGRVRHKCRPFWSGDRNGAVIAGGALGFGIVVTVVGSGTHTSQLPRLRK